MHFVTINRLSCTIVRSGMLTTSCSNLFRGDQLVRLHRRKIQKRQFNDQVLYARLVIFPSSWWGWGWWGSYSFFFFSMVLHSRRRINRSSWKREGERDHTKEKEAKGEKYTISSVPGLTSCMEDIVLEPSFFFFFFFLPFSLKALTCFVRLRLLAVQTSTNKQPKKRGLLRLAGACRVKCIDGKVG